MINTDVHPQDQPQGTFRYVLNGVNQTNEGEMSRISSEKGTIDCLTLSQGWEVVNYLYIGVNKYVIYQTNGTDSEIGVLDRCVYTTVFNDPCLNFDPAYPVFSTYRIRNGCETTVYFTDFLNPVRRIVLEDEVTNCDDLALFRTSSVPDLTVETQPFGGQLDPGSYYFAVRFLDMDSNPTNWLQYAGPTSVINLYDPYTDVVGTFSASVDPVAGSSTQSSIQVNVSSPSGFPYWQYAVIPYNSGNGVAGTPLVSPKINSNILSVTYTGQHNGFTETTLDDLLIDRISIDRARYIEQIENRLVLANVASKTRNWCKYQRFANNINTHYWVNEVDTKEIELEGDPKNPNYGKWLGYMGDEIYAYGVVYVFADGSTSPAFHIPGTAPSGDDLLELTVTSAFAGTGEILLDEVRHLGLNVGEKVATYKVKNTADPTTRKMAYWQSDQAVYPTDVDCDGAPIWGNLAGLPVRHHRFPCRKTEPHVNGRMLRHLGIEFSNIIYPDADIVGHFYVRADREEQDKTVVEKGYFFESWTDSPTQRLRIGEMKQDPNTIASSPVKNQKVSAVVTPKQLFNGTVPSANYIKTEYGITNTGLSTGAIYTTDQNNFETIAGTVFLVLNINEYRLDQTVSNVTPTNISLNYITEVDPRESKALPFGNVDNYSYTNPFLLIRTDSNIPTTTGTTLYGGFKKVADPYNVLTSLEYVPMTSTVFVGNGTHQVLGGDTFISDLNLYNLCKELNERNIFGTLININWWGSVLSSMYVETDINVSLALDNNERCTSRFRPTKAFLTGASNDTDAKDGLDFIKEQLTEPDIDSTDIIYMGPCEGYFALNADYSVSDRFKVHFPLTTYDCCSQCLGLYPHRIVYSEQSFQEEMTDSFQTFLANNYRDIEAKSGPISQIVRYEERLLLFTPETVWYLPPSLQERASNDGIISYVGTGSFFEIPPRKFNESLVAGLSDPTAIQMTPYGLVFYDSVSNVPYIVTNKIEPINYGVKRFFKSRTNFLKDYATDNWIVMGYDENLNRVLFTKRETNLQDGVVFMGEEKGFIRKDAYNGKLVFNSEAEQFYTVHPQLGVQVVSVNNETFFCNQTFSLSYSFDSPLKEKWTSFHSYHPDWYFTGKEEILLVSGRNIGELNEGKYQNYFGTKYPFTVDLVQRAQEPRKWDYIEYMTEAELDGANLRWVTFDELWVYNNYQLSGLLPIISKNQLEGVGYIINQIVNQTTADRTDRTWRIDGFRSKVGTANEKLFLNSCDQKQTDKTINTAVLNEADWTNFEPFNGKFVQLRFSMRNLNDIKLTFFDTTPV